MPVLTDFLVEAGAGIVGVFAGVVLALWTERRRRARDEEAEKAQQAERLSRVKDIILTSVVRNTSEAKSLLAALDANQDPYLFQASFESSAWVATRSQFFALGSLEERVIFTRFFDQAGRVANLIDFYRRVAADLELQRAADAGDRKLLADIRARLRTVAEDVRLDGVVVVTDHGSPLHKRLLGLRVPAEGVTPNS